MTDSISFKDFQKVDIRIGTVTKAEVPRWSHWVMKLTVDLGPNFGNRVCFSGIMRFFKSKDLEGKQFPFVTNLKFKKVGPEGDTSECMMVMAVPSESEEVAPVLFNLAKKVENGTKVY